MSNYKAGNYCWYRIYRPIPPNTAKYRQILRIWQYIITSSVIILSNINITFIENIILEILNFFKRRRHVSQAVFISSDIVHGRLISSDIVRYRLISSDIVYGRLISIMVVYIELDNVFMVV